MLYICCVNPWVTLKLYTITCIYNVHTWQHCWMQGMCLEHAGNGLPRTILNNYSTFTKSANFYYRVKVRILDSNNCLTTAEQRVSHINPQPHVLCSQEGVEVRVARIFNTFGSRMHMNDGRVVSNFILQALQGEPLTVRVLRSPSSISSFTVEALKKWPWINYKSEST